MGDPAGELDRLFAIDLDRILDVAVEGGFSDLELLVRREPEHAAKEIREIAAGHLGVEDAVQRLERLSPVLDPAALRRLLATLAADQVAGAVAVAREFWYVGDPADLVPADGLIAAVRSLPQSGPLDEQGRAVWELLRSVAARFDWTLIAELLEAAGIPGERTSWLDEALDREAWARPAGLGPVTDMSDDDAEEQAAAHSARVETTIRSWVAADRSPAGWLRLLGSALPGCGEPSCCRTGRFEEALHRRGILARAGRASDIPGAGVP